jgi:hypothetical protein
MHIYLKLKGDCLNDKACVVSLIHEGKSISLRVIEQTTEGVCYIRYFKLFYKVLFETKRSGPYVETCGSRASRPSASVISQRSTRKDRQLDYPGCLFCNDCS